MMPLMQGLILLSLITTICIASAQISFTSSNDYSNIILDTSSYSEKAIKGHAGVPKMPPGSFMTYIAPTTSHAGVPKMPPGRFMQEIHAGVPKMPRRSFMREIHAGVPKMPPRSFMTYISPTASHAGEPKMPPRSFMREIHAGVPKMPRRSFMWEIHAGVPKMPLGSFMTYMAPMASQGHAGVPKMPPGSFMWEIHAGVRKMLGRSFMREIHAGVPKMPPGSFMTYIAPITSHAGVPKMPPGSFMQEIHAGVPKMSHRSFMREIHAGVPKMPPGSFMTYIAPTTSFGPIYSYPPGSTASAQGNPVAAPTESEGPKSHHRLPPGLNIAIPGAGVLGVVLTIFYLSRSLTSPRAAVPRDNVHSNIEMESYIIADAVLSSNQLQFPEPTLDVYTNFSPHDILHIKSYCSESDPVGVGSFARVYKMSFHGAVLAIKEIQHRSPHTKRWVQNEVDLMIGKEHTNINKLYSWCIEENISYLAYMYIDGCSLDDYLRGNCVGFAYSWKQSLKLMMGIAKGIEFLHRNRIIHVDIKPHNVMVDRNDNEAKIVDFGLSKHVDWQGTHRSTAMVVGTRGYWAPEYCWNNRISYKHDVYSFGIVVLEMVTGERHVDEARGSSQFHIPGYVRHMIENNRFEEAVDARLKQEGWDNICLEQALAAANIALRCAHPDKAARPDMNAVVTEITYLMRVD